MENKLFNKLIDISGREDKFVSKKRLGREYMMSRKIADQLNTYRTFVPFTVFTDTFTQSYDANGNITTKDGPQSLGTRSIFNKMGAVMLGGVKGKGSSQIDDIINDNTVNEWRISNNVPLMDNREIRKKIRENSDCTVKNLVESSSKGLLGKALYDYSDFMYCKHLGKIPNNYMVTLRRFPLPVDDYISSLGIGKTRQEIDVASKNSTPIGCLVTWIGTPGNDMGNFLKYSYKMPFESKTADWQDGSYNADAQASPFQSIASIFDPEYRKQYQNSQASSSANAMLSKFFPFVGDAHYPAQDWNRFRDNNKVYGPVDVVKQSYMRGKQGLEFSQTFTIVFEYELRSYDGINGRQAMLDLLSNILNVTYSTGAFWGGGYYGYGAHQNNIFANMNIFKQNKGFTGFVDSLWKDLKTIGQNINLKNAGEFLNDLGGMLLAGFLNKMGRPQKIQLQSLLSPAPVGFWHLTIGNPFHPIMSVGNLILTNTEIEHYGPLGLDDFPTGLRVTCTLERGKGRDIRDIEKLYMHGNDRIYTSMGPKVFDMYKNSQDYKGNVKMDTIVGDANATVTTNTETIKIDDMNNFKHVLQKHFGHTDTYSIYVTACEQEFGAHKQQKTKEAEGDSRA